MSGFADIIGRLDETNRLPLYQQLQRALRQAITSKALTAEAALPPERDMAEEFSISRITVRKALDGLVEEGLLTRRQGSGTFVAGQRVEKNFSKLSSFTEDMAARGRKAHSIWLSRAEGAVTPDEALSLGVAPGSTVYRFHRIRYADEAPMALEYSVVPSFCLPGVETVGDSLYTALDHAGCRPVRALQRLRAVLFTADQAQLLGVSERDAGLRIERRGFLENGRLVEITTSFYRGDAYDFVAELNALSS